MTIEQLLNLSTESLTKMTDAEIEQHFLPMLPMTRPKSLVSDDSDTTDTKPKTKKSKYSSKKSFQDLFAEALALVKDTD